MNTRKWLVIGGTVALAALLALALTAGLTQAQEPAAEGDARGAAEAAANVYGRIPIQGRLTDASGNPLPDGSYYVTFSLYDASTGGSVVCDQSMYVSVENGLFYDEITNCSSLDIDGRQLYLAIEVEDDGEMTPRQPIYPVPYAMSLRPGAVISSASLGSNAALHIENWGPEGRGLRSYAMDTSSANYGIVGASRSPDGMGGYFYNTSAGPDYGFAVVGTHPGYGVGDIEGWTHPAGYFAGQIGLMGYSDGGTAVMGVADGAEAWSAMFTSNGHGVRISTLAGKTGLEVIGGTKSAVVPTDDGDRLLYTEESSEVWFTDYGFGALQDGVAAVAIDPLFAQTVNLEQPYHVFVQVYGNAEVYVRDRTSTGFEVHLRDGEPDVEFSYRIVGKRLGYEDHRLELSPGAGEANLHPGQE
jgi:hypothetical protein